MCSHSIFAANTADAIHTVPSIFFPVYLTAHKPVVYCSPAASGRRRSHQTSSLAQLYRSGFLQLYVFSSHQFSSVAQSCLTLCDPMDCSTPGLPVHHQLLEFTQTHVHRVGDAIQPSHPVTPFSSCLQSFPASGSFQMSLFFPSGGQSIGVSASSLVLPMNIQG